MLTCCPDYIYSWACAGLPEDSVEATMCAAGVVKTVGTARLLLKAPIRVPGACQWLVLGQSEPVFGMMLTILQVRRHIS